MSGQRQTHRYLTVVLLAHLAAILPGHTDRMTALLGKPGVVDDPRLNRLIAGDRWQDTFAYPRQYRLIGPGCLRHKVEQRLVLRCGSLRRSHCRQWFDTLAALGRQQPDTIVLERPHPVGMAQHRRQVCRVGAEAFLRAGRVIEIHPTLPGRFESPLITKHTRVAPSKNCRPTSPFCDSVGLCWLHRAAGRAVRRNLRLRPKPVAAGAAVGLGWRRRPPLARVAKW